MSEYTLREFLPWFLEGLVTRLPVYLVYVLGIVLALVRWRRHPRISGLTCLSLAMLTLLDMGNIALLFLLPRYMQRHRMSGEALTQSLYWVGMAHATLFAVIFILILWAIFGQRPARAFIDPGAEQYPLVETSATAITERTSDPSTGAMTRRSIL